MYLNRVILAGNLTRDPELKFTGSKVAVCSFGMAMNRKWRDKDGNSQDETCFVDCTAWAKTAETINSHMHKGKPILIEGRLRYEQWEGKDGQRRNKLSVTVESFSFVPDGQPREQSPRPPADPEPDYQAPSEGGDDIPF